MDIKYRELGVCGLSCRLCPRYHTDAESRCGGCKSEQRVAVGCPFITCAVKKQAIEFCWDCHDGQTCEKWAKHRGFGRQYDTFKCYQKLEDNISAIAQSGIDSFEEQQKVREQILTEMLAEFNEGRSKSYYCIAATVMAIEELREALDQARKESEGLGIKDKSRVMHSILDNIASKRSYYLKLRKWK
ncbi:MAG: DUF3795 domain-containing protein [Dehalococcoidales bacterium]|nr:MAG: DUF3795 domain-containing protein [Dehalococcoidales bacterium]